MYKSLRTGRRTNEITNAWRYICDAREYVLLMREEAPLTVASWCGVDAPGDKSPCGPQHPCNERDGGEVADTSVEIIIILIIINILLKEVRKLKSFVALQ